MITLAMNPRPKRNTLPPVKIIQACVAGSCTDASNRAIHTEHDLIDPVTVIGGRSLRLAARSLDPRFTIAVTTYEWLYGMDEIPALVQSGIVDEP